MTDFLKHKLSTDKHFSENALFKIFERQTDEEKARGYTTDHNNIGFNGIDGKLLTNLVENISKKRKSNPTYRFSNKQFQVIIFKRMPKYWKQILDISDNDKLEKYYNKHMKNGLQLQLSF